MSIIKQITDELMKKYSEEVSQFYDVETLTNDEIERKLKKLYNKNERLQEVLAMMERVEGQHPDLMDYYEERDGVWKKIFALEKFCCHRRNLRIKEIEKNYKKKRKKIYNYG